MAERYRYVELPEHSSITADLAQSSADMANELEAAKEAANLHVEKHMHIKKAESLIDEISKDVAKFMRMVPIKQPNRPLKAKAEKPIVEFSARTAKQIMTESDREMIARSHRALANLQKNLAELKSELGRVR